MTAARTLFACLIAVLIVSAVAPRGGLDRAEGASETTTNAVPIVPTQTTPPATPTAAPSATTDAPIDQGGPGGRVQLSGPWTLRSDHLSHGTAKGFQAGAFVGSAVTVPYVPNATRVTGSGASAAFKGTVAWYRTAFTVPNDGLYAIRFESVNHRATVWVDGRKITQHTGEYLPFEARVNLAADHSHLLVVRSDYRNPLQMKKLGWHRTWFNFGGINREVTVRRITDSELNAPTVRTRLQPDGSALVDLSVHVVNHTGQRSIPVDGTLSNGDTHIPFSFPAMDYVPGQTRVLKTTVTVPNPALWAPGSPNLYDLALQVPNESSFDLKTGLRELKKVGTQLLLNGKPIKLRGASIHEDVRGKGDALTGADMDNIVSELKAIGANATRAQHPLSPALMERLDAAGIMIWMGIGPVDAPGAWTSNTPKLRAQAKRRVRTTLYQLQTHPSIIAWNLANEVAGNGHPGGQASYIDQMAQELHRRDPGRMVALDVWGVHPPTKAGPMYRHIDAIGDTNYIGWYSDTLRSHAQVAAAIRRHIASFKRVFAGKIVAVTEFGAESNGMNATGKPGGYKFQADLLRLHIDIYRKLPGLSGMLVWNLRDFAVSPAFAGGSIRHQVPNIRITRGLNQKGLYNYAGQPKLAARVVGSLFNALATSQR